MLDKCTSKVCAEMFGIPGSPKVLPGRPCLCCGGWPCQLVGFDHVFSCLLGGHWSILILMKRMQGYRYIWHCRWAKLIPESLSLAKLMFFALSCDCANLSTTPCFFFSGFVVPPCFYFLCVVVSALLISNRPFNISMDPIPILLSHIISSHATWTPRQDVLPACKPQPEAPTSKSMRVIPVRDVWFFSWTWGFWGFWRFSPLFHAYSAHWSHLTEFDQLNLQSHANFQYLPLPSSTFCGETHDFQAVFPIPTPPAAGLQKGPGRHRRAAGANGDVRGTAWCWHLRGFLGKNWRYPNSNRWILKSKMMYQCDFSPCV